MAVLPIQIRETGRQRLSTLLWVVHWVCAICGLSIILIGLYLKIRIQDKVRQQDIFQFLIMNNFCVCR